MCNISMNILYKRFNDCGYVLCFDMQINVHVKKYCVYKKNGEQEFDQIIWYLKTN